MGRLQIHTPSSVDLQRGLPRIRATFGVAGSGHTRSRFLFTNVPESAFSFQISVKG
jgi:hypothetical protein